MNMKTTGLCLSVLALALVGCKARPEGPRLTLDTGPDNRQASNSKTILIDAPTQNAGKSGGGADDATIAQVSALLLDRRNFVQKADHNEISTRFLDHYWMRSIRFTSHIFGDREHGHCWTIYALRRRSMPCFRDSANHISE